MLWVKIGSGLNFGFFGVLSYFLSINWIFEVNWKMLVGVMSPTPINIFKSFLKMSYIIKKCQIIAKKFENLTLPLWRPIEQGKIRRTIFHCVFYYIVCKSEYILGSLFFRINIFKNLLKMSCILKNGKSYQKIWKFNPTIVETHRTSEN